jgi:hypothetical protein
MEMNNPHWFQKDRDVDARLHRSFQSLLLPCLYDYVVVPIRAIIQCPGSLVLASVALLRAFCSVYHPITIILSVSGIASGVLSEDRCMIAQVFEISFTL